MSFNVKDDFQLSEDGTTLLLTTKESQLRQAIEIGLQIFRGQWIYDPSSGVPYLQTVFVKGTPIEVIRQAFRREVTKIPGVIEIIELGTSYDKQTSTLRVDMRISGENGVVVAITTEFQVV